MTLMVTVFDEFAYVCPYFTSETDANNGYGCNHPDQEETQNRDGKEQGCCYCFSCPLGIEADAEDLDNPDIDWDGLCEEREVMEGEYLMVNTGEDASLEEKEALENYIRYLNRYNIA